MKKRFIVIVDRLKDSEHLIQYAFDWARQTQAELLIIHQTFVHAPVFIDSEEKLKIIDQTKEEALEQLKAMVERIVQPFVKVNYYVSDHHLQLILPKVLQAGDQDLILVGLRETGLLERMFIGNTALQVIDNTNNIVVAIPQEINSYSHKKVFVAVKEQQTLNTESLHQLLHFMSRESVFTFFYLSKPNEETEGVENRLKNLADEFSDKINTTYEVFKGKDPFSAIEEVINDKIDEILVVQKGARLLTDHLFRRFLINHLVNKGQTPLVVLP